MHIQLEVLALSVYRTTMDSRTEGDFSKGGLGPSTTTASGLITTMDAYNQADKVQAKHLFRACGRPWLPDYKLLHLHVL